MSARLLSLTPALLLVPGCLLGAPEPLADTGPGAATDTYDDGSAPAEGEETAGGGRTYDVCWSPGEDMYAGQLRLYDVFVDDAVAGEREVCAPLTGLSGEEVKMNAWYRTSASSEVLWAAYNDWCTEVGFRGNLTVDGVAITPRTEWWPGWEAELAAEGDLCDIGGDAYFDLP